MSTAELEKTQRIARTMMEATHIVTEMEVALALLDADIELPMSEIDEMMTDIRYAMEA